MKQTKSANLQLKPVIIDALGISYGRLASQVATLLLGKDLPTFDPSIVVNRQVMIRNLRKIKLPDRKNRTKTYYRHSRFPGSLKKSTFDELVKKDLKHVFTRSVYNMLPKNRLRTRRLSKLILQDEPSATTIDK